MSGTGGQYLSWTYGQIFTNVFGVKDIPLITDITAQKWLSYNNDIGPKVFYVNVPSVTVTMDTTTLEKSVADGGVWTKYMNRPFDAMAKMLAHRNFYDEPYDPPGVNDVSWSLGLLSNW